MAYSVYGNGIVPRSKTMRNTKIREMTIYAMFVAIIALMSFVPSIGFITIGPVSFTIIPAVVIICAFSTGWKGGLISGFAFGLFSMILSLSSAVTPWDIEFQNPLVSILPRLIFGLVAGLIGEYVTKKTYKTKATKFAFIAGGSAISTLIHTCLVFVMMVVCIPLTPVLAAYQGTTFWMLFATVITVNGLIELSLALIIAPLVINSLLPIIKKK